MMNSACFSMSNQDLSSQAPGPQQQSGPGDGEEPNIIPGLRSLNVMGTTNILEHFLSVAQMVPANLSNNTRNVYSSQAGVFPIAGEVKTLTAPAQLAYLQLGSEICNDLVSKEAVAGATKSFFEQVDLTAANGAITPAVLDNVKGKLARSFWGRAPASEELQIINTKQQR